MTDTTDAVGVAGDRIRSIIERIEEEIKDSMETKKEVFAEAKGEGLDVKVLKENTLLDLYLRATDAPSAEPLADAAWDKPVAQSLFNSAAIRQTASTVRPSSRAS